MAGSDVNRGGRKSAYIYHVRGGHMTLEGP